MVLQPHPLLHLLQYTIKHPPEAQMEAEQSATPRNATSIDNQSEASTHSKKDGKTRGGGGGLPSTLKTVRIWGHAISLRFRLAGHWQRGATLLTSRGGAGVH